jgi:hypothetical protein
MSEDVCLLGSKAWPARTVALDQLPEALRPNRLERWPIVQRQHGVDETSITLMDIQRDHGFDEVCLQRQQWLFDEDSLTWLLDQNEEWWISADAASKLLRLLGS